MDADGRITPFPGPAPGSPPEPHPDAPPGKLELVVTYLEMLEAPPVRRTPYRSERLALMRAERPTAAYYRFLYETVGGPWLWFERRLLSDGELLAQIRHPLVEVYVLYVGGVPGGYVELDRRVEDEVELAYFGLMPDFLGRGLGGWLLDWAVERAWFHEPRRVWVNTCNLDHPAAFGAYQKAGFAPYRQERKLVDDPRLPGAMPPGREFR